MIKPGNVMALPDGKVKVLDFGLARAPDANPASNLSNSPTLSMAATQAGVILGTAAYMSPEQANGLSADSRSDVFSFGCVLYEMLSGRQTFQGETASEVLASVLVRDPDFKLLPPHLNPRLYDLLLRCLEKTPKRRWQAVGDLRADLEVVAGELYPATAAPAAIPAPSRKREKLAWSLLALATIVITVLGALLFRDARSPEASNEIRFQVAVPNMPSAYEVSVSPDGRWIAFVAATSPTPNATALFLRQIGSTESQPLTGTAGASQPFWSPDSRSIAFFAGGQLKRVETSGGSPQTLCKIANFFGGTWNDAGEIVFSSGSVLHRVPASGGQPAPITELNQSQQETAHHWPYFLPDGRHYLYLAWSREAGNRAIYAGSLDSEERIHVLAAESMPVYAEPGYLFFQRQGDLFAQPFETAKLQVSGEAVRLADGIPYSSISGRAAFAVSGQGTMVYRSAVAAANTRFAWFDRRGVQLRFVGQPGPYGEFDLSPDGERIVVSKLNPSAATRNLWVMEWERDVSTRLTFDAVQNEIPVWSPDGLTVAYSSNPKGNMDIFTMKASGVGQGITLLNSDVGEFVDDWSRDGRYLAYSQALPAGPDLYVLPLFDDRKPFPVVQSPGGQDEAHFSPDGKWLAYHSNESGVTQVYVISFPVGDQKRQISTNGGGQPRWRRDGSELFYLGLDGNLMAVDITTGATIDSRSPRVLFDTELNGSSIAGDQYAVSADGQRFLLRKPVTESTPTAITAVVNWTAALKK